MNAQVSKRIRRASRACGRKVSELKREYRILPYHRRGHRMWEPHSDCHRIYIGWTQPTNA